MILNNKKYEKTNFLKVKKKWLVFFISGVILVNCNGKSKLDIDISNTNIKLDVHRFDKEFLNADLYQIRKLNAKWRNDYDLLYDSFLYQMIRIGDSRSKMVTVRIEKYLADSTTRTIAKEMDSVFQDFSKIKTDLTNAFKHYNYYFPDSTIPKIVTFYSNFNAKAFPEKHQLGIGLDMFLGKDNKIVKVLPNEDFPTYLKDKMDKQYLVSNVMKHWIYFKFSELKDFRNNGIFIKKNDFLNTIIHHGKMLYILDAMMPNENILNKLEYTKEQHNWCLKSEKYLYQTLVENKLIYSKSYKEISRFINPGPFTNGFPEAAPSGIGKWIGYRMVKQYMEGNNISISELISRTNDSRKILSYYRL